MPTTGSFLVQHYLTTSAATSFGGYPLQGDARMQGLPTCLPWGTFPLILAARPRIIKAPTDNTRLRPMIRLLIASDRLWLRFSSPELTELN